MEKRSRPDLSSCVFRFVDSDDKSISPVCVSAAANPDAMVSRSSFQLAALAAHMSNRLFT